MRRVKVVLRGNPSLFLSTLSDVLVKLGFELPQMVGDVKTFNIDIHVENPDVAIIDIESDHTDRSLADAHAMRLKTPSLGIVFLSSFYDQRMVGMKQEMAPQDSLLIIKPSVNDISEIREALINAAHNRVRKGDAFHFSTVQLENRSNLTDRQVALLREIAMGFSNLQMAKVRGVSVNAVENAISRLAKKLEVPRLEHINQRVTLAALYYCGRGRFRDEQDVLEA